MIEIKDGLDGSEQVIIGSLSGIEEGMGVLALQGETGGTQSAESGSSGIVAVREGR